jgi:hypothetical protein
MSPGASSLPAKRLPSITLERRQQRLAMSPE